MIFIESQSSILVEMYSEHDFIIKDNCLNNSINDMN